VTVALAATGTGEGLVGFEGSGRRTTSRLLDGEFPKYRSPAAERVGLGRDIETASFVESVKRVALVPSGNPGRLAFSDACSPSKPAPGTRRRQPESIEATLDGDAITIAFNPGYLLDGLGALDAPYRAALVHHADQAGRPGRCPRRPTASRSRRTATLLMPYACRAELAFESAARCTVR
jgi:DNA polymerase-3 subunit beta